MITTCTRRFQFAYGHRVFGHENKCGSLHGHNAVVHITAQADLLDDVGRVVDFGVLKQKYGEWIESFWDHAMLLWDKDSQAISAVTSVNDTNGLCSKTYLLPYNPTAENMAQYLLDKGSELMGDTGVQIVKVIVWETENCYAEAKRDVVLIDGQFHKVP